MKLVTKILCLLLLFAFSVNIVQAFTEKEKNYYLYNGIAGSLMTPSNDDLYFQLKEVNSKIYVNLQKNKFEAIDFKIDNNSISFYILTSDKPESRLTFEGNIYKTVMSGIVFDTNKKSGSWVLKLNPIRNLFLYSSSRVSSPVNSQVTTDSAGQKSTNPMKNWTYYKAGGDYYDVVVKELTRSKLKLYRYRKFPVACWIQPMKPDWMNQIHTALNFLNNFMPIKFVNSQAEADLTIKLGSPDDIKKNCNHKTALGCGGTSVVTPSVYKGQLLLSPDIFQDTNTNGIILHEITHTFGILGHSKNPEDLMYHLSYNQNNFTAADLNTLWLHYNQ